MSEAVSMLRDRILQLERDLLRDEVRCDPLEIARRLADDFTEFASSGKEYLHVPGSCFGSLAEVVEIEDGSFRVKHLSDTVVLACYRTRSISGRQTNRSTLWVLDGSQWKASFHQGTPTLAMEEGIA